jgi:hypothetical protein
MKEAEKFITLQNELSVFRKLMTQAAKVILDQGVSKYPILVVHQQELELGMKIYDHTKVENAKWSVHASTLEEFVTRQIIFENKVEDFKTNYKSIDTSICIFVLSELGAKFIFLPIAE